MTTQNTDKLKQDFGKAFHDLIPLVVAIICLDMAEKLTLGFLEQEAEKALGRPLTAYDRMLLQKEHRCRQACGWLVTLYEAYYQRYRDDEVIRQVVWRRA